VPDYKMTKDYRVTIMTREALYDQFHNRLKEAGYNSKGRFSPTSVILSEMFHTSLEKFIDRPLPEIIADVENLISKKEK